MLLLNWFLQNVAWVTLVLLATCLGLPGLLRSLLRRVFNADVRVLLESASPVKGNTYPAIRFDLKIIRTWRAGRLRLIEITADIFNGGTHIASLLCDGRRLADCPGHPAVITRDDKNLFLVWPLETNAASLAGQWGLRHLRLKLHHSIAGDFTIWIHSLG